jgi:hypothetical protein
MGRALTYIRRRPEMAALVALLATGLAVRIYFLAVWGRAITGFSDSGTYFQEAFMGVWSDPIRTVGYGMFIHVLHAITPHLFAVALVQHALGLGAAALWFLTVRRIGGPPWLGLVPAAVVALGGDQLFLEHGALSESLYMDALVATLYCTVRARDQGWGWAAGAGLFLALSVWIRYSGIVLLPVIPLWLLISRRPLSLSRQAVMPAAAALLVSIAVLGIYAGWRQLASGHGGLTTNGNWNLYGRVAPWADCTKFTPPAGTERLCDPEPVAQRNLDYNYYLFSPDSPANRLLGGSLEYSSGPQAMDRLRRFSIAAIEGQPFDYLNAVWQDTIRVIDPNHSSFGGYPADGFYDTYINGPDRANRIVAFWQDHLYPDEPYSSTHHGDIDPLMTWERLTRSDGALMIALLLLSIVALWSPPGEARSGARLMAAVGLSILFFPLPTKGYDFRYVVPAVAPLSAAAALGAWGIRIRLMRTRRDTQSGAPPPSDAPSRSTA